MGQDKGFPKPGIGMPTDPSKPHTIVDARNESSRPVLFDGAVEGHVLLKNTKNALPLRKPRLLSIFGYSAKLPDANDVSIGTTAWTLGGESFEIEELQSGFAGEEREHSAIARHGTIISGGGSGATSQSRIISPLDAIVQQAYTDDTALFWDFATDSPTVDPATDACLVVVNAYASEGFDRPNLHDDYTDGLIKNVADQCNSTIVVFHNAGARLVDQWIDHPNVTGLIFAHLPGQDSGKALVSILYGDSNPSGKLPYTVAKNESDYGEVLKPTQPDNDSPGFPQSNFSEGVFIDYRYFDAHKIEPRFEFGFGLSYTTFKYSNLTVTKEAGGKFADFPSGRVIQGGPTDLWDVLARVSATIANTGPVGGAEVAQLYVGIPGDDAPVRQLRGFEKPSINATQTATVEFELTRRDLSVWDVVAQKWRLPRGDFGVWVGASSRDLPLKGKLTI